MKYAIHLTRGNLADFDVCIRPLDKGCVMNVLLTGGTGYIGSHTAVVLAEAGHRIILYDNLSNSKRIVVYQLKEITGQPVIFVEGDVRDTELLSSTLKHHEIDAVIHFAGLKAVGDSVARPVDYFSNNVCGTVSLLQAMQANSIKNIVFSSSATVYGEPNYLPYDERHPTNAINPYGRTKLYVEEILTDLSASDSKWSIAALRYFNPAGAHSSALIGEMPSGIPNNLMPCLTRVASGRSVDLSVFGSDYSTRDGTAERDYIHVMDLADGHLSALNYIDRNPGWHIFNLGTGKSVTVLELINAFEFATKMHVPIKMVARRAGDLPAYYASTEKAKKLLGWEAKRTIGDICHSAWAWELTQGDSTNVV